MKVVINDCSGWFGINSEIAEQYFDGEVYDIERTNTTLIDLIESGVNCNAPNSKLKVVYIPDDATDWQIFADDGLEEVVYVVDGKIYSSFY